MLNKRNFPPKRRMLTGEIKVVTTTDAAEAQRRMCYDITHSLANLFGSENIEVVINSVEELD